MHGAAIQAAREKPPALQPGAAAEEAAEARLCAAVAYCVGLRDAIGRTPTHYAARAGEGGFVQWACGIVALRPADASEALLEP
eukprot:156559-Prymnesium_polylepis.1